MDAVSHGHRPLMKGQWCRASSTKQDQLEWTKSVM